MPSRKKGSRSRDEKSYEESDVSKAKRVQNALRDARRSSRERSEQNQHPPRTPTGLVIGAYPDEHNGPETPRSLHMNSPSISDIGHMDQLLAPTYDSRDNNGGSTFSGSSSINTSDDIIRKVEMEIATARKAATEAQLRLSDALEKSWELQHKYSSVSENNHDPLDDLDIPLRDILSLSSTDHSPECARQVESDRNMPNIELAVDTKPEEEPGQGQDGADALKNIESAVSGSEEGSNNPDDETDPTEPTESPTGSSSNGSNGSDCLRYTGTQQTFESGVELGLEDVEATLAVVDTEDHHSTNGESSHGNGNATTRSETLPDEFSEYTEETVSDDLDDEEDDDSSEYTEETVHSGESDGELDDTDGVPEDTNDVDAPEDAKNAEDKSRELNDAEKCASPKPWIVGSRDMHKSPKDAKPWWSGGWWPDEEKAKKAAQNGDKPTGTEKTSKNSSNGTTKEALAFPPSCVDGNGYIPTMSSYETESRANTTFTDGERASSGPLSPWSTAPDTDDGDTTNAESDQTDKDEDPGNKPDKEEKTTEATSDEAPAPRDSAVNNVDAVPQANSDSPKRETKDGSAKIEFRQPYPVPPQVARARPAPDIIADHTTGLPKRVTRWSTPKSELNDLLATVKGDSLHRRSNAIGALKMLLTRESKNEVILVRTTGFLEALVFACSEDIQSSPEMETALIARNRAVTTIMKVSGPKDNRILVMTEPGLPECLVKTIKEDIGEARAHACAALAMLAKTSKNREYMVQVEDLVSTLALVVNGTIDPQISPAFDQNENSARVGALSLDDEASKASASTYEHQSSVANPYSSDSIRKQKLRKKSEFELQAKINACAVLMHLSKHCSVSSTLEANHTFMDSMMMVSCDFDSPLKTKCIEILCNITRFHANNADMARNFMLVDTLLKCGKSKVEEDRVWALRAFQNIAADSSSKAILANSKILTLLSICAMRKEDEQEAAVAAIYNLSTEPSAVVPMTNTRNVVATLVHLAHNPNVSPKVQRMSCDALATTGLWLQTLAGTGSVPEGVPKSLLPTHRTVGWQRWD